MSQLITLLQTIFKFSHLPQGKKFSRELIFANFFFGYFAAIIFRELGFTEDFAGINFRELSFTRDFAGKGDRGGGQRSFLHVTLR